MSVSFLIDLIYFYIPGDPSKSSFWFGKDEVDPLTFPSEDLAGGGGGGGVLGVKSSLRRQLQHLLSLYDSRQVPEIALPLAHHSAPLTKASLHSRLERKGLNISVTFILSSLDKTH